MVSVIILSYNTEKILKQCLQSVIKSLQDVQHEIIVVDNNSHDESVRMVKDTFPVVRVLENSENVGFAKGVNQGVSSAKGEYLLLINSDTEMQDDSFHGMLEFAKKNDGVSIIGGHLKNADGSTSKSYGKFYTVLNVMQMLFFDKNKKMSASTTPKKVDWVSGGYMLIKKPVYDSLHGFDERFFMYIEDMEFCYRAKQKHFGVWYYPKSVIKHIGQGSSNRTFAILNIYKGLLYFYKKHKSPLAYQMVRLLLVCKSVLSISIGLVTRNAYLIGTYKQALQIAI